MGLLWVYFGFTLGLVWVYFVFFEAFKKKMNIVLILNFLSPKTFRIQFFDACNCKKNQKNIFFREKKTNFREIKDNSNAKYYSDLLLMMEKEGIG